MSHRSPARWLAPAALIVCAVAVVAVVNSTVTTTGDGAATTMQTTTGPRPPGSRTTTSTTTSSVPRTSTTSARTYTIQAGDTLSAIAERTGVPLARIQELNPGIDSQALRTGQRIRLSG